MAFRWASRWVFLVALIGVGLCYATKAREQTVASLTLDELDQKLQVGACPARAGSSYGAPGLTTVRNATS